MGIWIPILHMIPWAHQSPQRHNPNGILIGSAVFVQMTAECPYTLQWDAPFSHPLKIARSHGDLDPHLIHVPWANPSP